MHFTALIYYIIGSHVILNKTSIQTPTKINGVTYTYCKTLLSIVANSGRHIEGARRHINSNQWYKALLLGPRQKLITRSLWEITLPRLCSLFLCLFPIPYILCLRVKGFRLLLAILLG